MKSLAVILSLSLSTIAEGQSDSLFILTPDIPDKLVNEAMRHLGKPYSVVGQGPDSFDCSHFTSYVYRQLGIDLIVGSANQALAGREVEKTESLQKGDILVFGSRGNVERIGHVGLYVGNDESGDGILFIHASTHSGVCISNVKEEYYARRYMGARRIIETRTESPAIKPAPEQKSEPEPEPSYFDF